MVRKELGLIGVFSIAGGTMISLGLFVLPGMAFAKAGPAMIISYALAGVLVIPVLLSIAELASAMPKSGGSYFFVERSLGPLVGTVTGLADWLSIALKATFAMVGIGALATLTFPGLAESHLKLIAVIACTVFTAANIVSVKGSGRVQIVLIVALMIILAVYVVKGLSLVDNSRYSPFMPSRMPSVFAVAGMVFLSFGGLTKVVAVSEEVHNPKKNLLLGMFLAFLVVSVLNICVVFVTVGIVQPEQLKDSLVPLALGGKASMGDLGTVLLGLAAFAAFATTANAGVLSASRIPLAMSRDGLLPEFCSRTSRLFKTPIVCLTVTWGFMVLVISLLSIENLVKTASTIMIIMFILLNFAVIIMRHSGIQRYRPQFTAPLNPWLQIGAIVVYVFIIFEMGRAPLIITGGFTLVAALWYIFYVQHRIDRESAFVYLVKRIVSRRIERSHLEEELKQISLERDGIVPDRFDDLVKECIILDVPGAITGKELFTQAAQALSPAVSLDPESLYGLFIARERESTTVVKPGLAIPHIVVEGANIFQILLVRCKQGVMFSELHEPVKTAFVLIGSPDERNYHLRALMIIAHIVSEADFETRWFQAKNAEQLRDILLLSSRKREK